jgi:hypothetical protein
VIKRLLIALAAVLFVFTASGCSTVSTEPDEVALHYSGGAVSSKKFKDCVGTSDRAWNGPGDQHYRYPAGQRTFSFTGAKGSERGPIAVTTNDGQEVLVPGFVTFTLNTECEALRAFHERIGIKYGAYIGGGGWESFLNDYIYTPLDSSMNKAALDGEVKGWKKLYADSSTQTEFENLVKDALPEEVSKAIGGDDFITINAVQVSKPNVDDSLKDALRAKEEQKELRDAQEEKNKVAASKYDSFKDCRRAGIGENTCLTIYLADTGKVPFYPIPQGGGLNVQPQAAN